MTGVDAFNLDRYVSIPAQLTFIRNHIPSWFRS